MYDTSLPASIKLSERTRQALQLMMLHRSLTISCERFQWSDDALTEEDAATSKRKTDCMAFLSGCAEQINAEFVAVVEDAITDNLAGDEPIEALIL